MDSVGSGVTFPGALEKLEAETREQHLVASGPFSNTAKQRTKWERGLVGPEWDFMTVCSLLMSAQFQQLVASDSGKTSFPNLLSMKSML